MAGKIVVLDPDLAQYKGEAAWHMIAWCHEDERPVQSLAVRKSLDKAVFIQKFAVVLEHFARKASRDLFEQYYQIFEHMTPAAQAYQKAIAAPMRRLIESHTEQSSLIQPDVTTAYRPCNVLATHLYHVRDQQVRCALE